jgi:hypothetical protein
MIRACGTDSPWLSYWPPTTRATGGRAPRRSNGSVASKMSSWLKRPVPVSSALTLFFDHSVPRRLAETALAREPAAPWCHYVLGLADFRMRQYEDAVAHLEESLKVGTGWPAAPLNYPLLAMAHDRLGHDDEARRWLDKAHGRDRAPARGVDVISSAVWWDRVEFRVLLREADVLVPDATFPSDPFAP